jgi:protein phosphatase 1L
VVPAAGAAAAAAAAAAVAAVEADPRNEVEEEGEEFAAYCRRGKGRRRVEMEDRHVAKVALGGDPQVVSFIESLFVRSVYFAVILEKKTTNCL